MIRRFKRREGKYIQEIAGQGKLGFSTSDMVDFYDLVQLSKQGGYQGSVLQFYDFENGEIYRPFEKRRNVIYGNPIFSKGYYYFLQGDYDAGEITLYKFSPDEALEKAAVFPMEKLELFNLHLMGENVHIVSQEEEFRCYYPETLAFPLEPQESVCLMQEGKIYSEKWIEEGWDKEKNCATDQYRFYHKIMIRDFKGNILSEEMGSLCQCSDGTWWIS